ncbi:cytochrome P450 [Tanacetum coccineum]
MYTPGPLGAPREAIEDCDIGVYHVSKETHLIVNIWKLHRDARIWSNRNEFRPYRFLEENSHINYQGHNFEYIPFRFDLSPHGEAPWHDEGFGPNRSKGSNRHVCDSGLSTTVVGIN